LIMKTLTKILIFLIIVTFTCYKSLGQNAAQQDSVKAKVSRTEAAINKNEQMAQGSNNSQAADAGRNNASRIVKQVKGARPDMSKARGARPPSITRPSGSGIPKGIGKPGGVGKRGGR